MNFYILLFLLVEILLIGFKHKFIDKIAFGLLCSVYAFRDNIALDDRNYIQVFEYVQHGWEYDVEWSYLMLCKLALYFDLNYKAVFMFYALLSFCFLWKTLDIIYKNNISKAVYLACFFGIAFVSSMSVMRQFLAASICFYAMIIMSKNNKIKATILCLIATFFHMGACISLPILYLASKKNVITYRFKLVLTIVSVICGYLNLATIILNASLGILPVSYQIYSDSISGSFSSAGGTLSLILLLLFLLQNIISAKGEKQVNKNNFIDCIVERGQLVYICILFFFVHAGVASRLAFTYILFAATIPITFIKRIKSTQQLGIFFVLILCMLLLMIMSVNSASEIREGLFIPYNASLKFWN